MELGGFPMDVGLLQASDCASLGCIACHALISLEAVRTLGLACLLAFTRSDSGSPSRKLVEGDSSPLSGSPGRIGMPS